MVQELGGPSVDRKLPIVTITLIAYPNVDQENESETDAKKIKRLLREKRKITHELMYLDYFDNKRIQVDMDEKEEVKSKLPLCEHIYRG